MPKEKIEEIAESIPRTIELKDAEIICPNCGTKIIATLDIDVSSIANLAKAFQEMGADNE